MPVMFECALEGELRGSKSYYAARRRMTEKSSFHLIESVPKLPYVHPLQSIDNDDFIKRSFEEEMHITMGHLPPLWNYFFVRSRLRILQSQSSSIQVNSSHSSQYYGQVNSTVCRYHHHSLYQYLHRHTHLLSAV